MTPGADRPVRNPSGEFGGPSHRGLLAATVRAPVPRACHFPRGTAPPDVSAPYRAVLDDAALSRISPSPSSSVTSSRWPLSRNQAAMAVPSRTTAPPTAA
ncbi:hypothetical protein GA0115252_11019 [Streptomyces sp. DfronAA-171]|nr:hypothetical protein GA0115252_11019 [Streptomyces sp. DfronAA-171]